MHPVKDAATLELLRGALKEPDPVVRELAADALAVIRDGAGERRPRAVLPSVAMPEALRSTNTIMLVRALRSLDAEGARRESATLLGLLRRPELVVQEEAVRAIQRGQITTAAGELFARLNDADEGLRLAATEALAGMFDQVPRPELTSAMVRRMELDPSSQVRRVAGHTLVALHDTPSRDALLRLLRYERGVTRVSTALALGIWGDAGLAGALHPLLADSQDLVVRAAAHALGQLRNAQSKGPLLSAFEARGPVVQERAAWALGELKSTNAVPALIARLGTTDEALKVSLVFALGKTGDKRVLQPLRQVLQQIVLTNNLPKAREAALTVLTELGDKLAMPRAIDMVTKPVVPPYPGAGPTYDEDFIRIAALRYLGTVGDRKTGAAVLAGLKDPVPREVRPALAETLGKLLGQKYAPVPDEDYRRYFIESTAYRLIQPAPPPGVVLLP
ncbi:MAG: HEAT repeat-containing PBS lyase [Limisphaerales bacterium]|nr:MAG: HEAT repeat-containing PBS lyase [Limisphaerales bacterium]TXT49256.1 MAG: HEAT repeat-containing PBS lyase [Limisphaerales bacterium]